MGILLVYNPLLYSVSAIHSSLRDKTLSKNVFLKFNCYSMGNARHMEKLVHQPWLGINSYCFWIVVRLFLLFICKIDQKDRCP